MTKPTTIPPLHIARQKLAHAMLQFHLPRPSPLDVSPWVAMSLLQKAIRRGRENLALQAAATLLERSPDNLWRRCGGIAFEDVGLGDPETLALVTAALAGKRFRVTLGGEWRVAAFIVFRMASAIKCRAADDLLMAAELHPDFSYARNECARLGTPELLRIALGPAPLSERAIALRYALGTSWRPSHHLQARRGDPKTTFDALSRLPDGNDLAEVAREGYRKVREPLCPFVTLLQPLRLRERAMVDDDPLPPEASVQGVPGWAYDVYSREGRVALAAFLKGGSKTARWVVAHVPPSKRVGVLGGIVFRVEGGLVRHRLRWPAADELRSMVDLGSHGLNACDAAEILELARQDIPALNAVRSDVC